jgi:hypothetical protein
MEINNGRRKQNMQVKDQKVYIQLKHEKIVI